MDDCFNCGISDKKVRLFEAVSQQGIIKACKECSHKENFPLIKQANSQEEQTVPKNFLSQISQEKPTNETNSWLTRNFHWIIMRARRLKHITQEELAKSVGESEKTIKDIEKGIISKYNFQLINKIENHLRIKLMIMNNKSLINPAQAKEQFKETMNFDKKTTEHLTISDLYEMKKEHEAKIFNEKSKEPKNIDNLEEDLEIPPKDNKKQELSKEEIDRIIFGR